MKRSLSLLFVVVVTVGVCRAQVVETTVCEILANPPSFSGKTVRVRGTVVLQPEEFALKSDCPGQKDPLAVWLEYGYPQPSPTPYCCPGGWDENGKPIFSTPRVVLLRDKNFAQLKHYLSKRREGRDNYGEECDRFQPAPTECQKYEVTATLTGRLSGVQMSSDEAGFGHFGMYPAKLVIHHVEQVSAREVKKAAQSSVPPRRERRPKRKPRIDK